MKPTPARANASRESVAGTGAPGVAPVKTLGQQTQEDRYSLERWVVRMDQYAIRAARENADDLISHHRRKDLYGVHGYRTILQRDPL
jgi:hypothetical protein